MKVTHMLYLSILPASLVERSCGGRVGARAKDQHTVVLISV